MVATQPNDYASPADRLADQDWAGTVRHTASNLAPADKGWVLAIVLMFAMLGAIFIAWFYFETQNSKRASDAIIKYLDVTHTNWVKFTEETSQRLNRVEENRSMENRELLRLSESCTLALARQSDRLGRKKAEEFTTEAEK